MTVLSAPKVTRATKHPRSSRANGRIRQRALWLVACGVLFSGCVTDKAHRKAVEAARLAGMVEKCGLVEDALASTQEELLAAKERLKRFNQLDHTGNLRELKAVHEACPKDGRHELVNGVCVDLTGK